MIEKSQKGAKSILLTYKYKQPDQFQYPIETSHERDNIDTACTSIQISFLGYTKQINDVKFEKY